jgi:hypothetical protein
MPNLVDARLITAGEICVQPPASPTLKVFNANGDCIAVLGTVDEYMGLIRRAGKI